MTTQRTENETGDAARDASAAPSDSPAEKQGALPRLLAWWQQTRVARGLARYGAANGALLTGGIAYSALFSIFAALLVGFAIFTAVLGGDARLQAVVLDGLDSALPGIVQTPDNESGIVSPESLRIPASGSVLVAIISFLVLLNTATAVMAALRAGIRAMFGIVMPAENAVKAKLRDLAGFAVLALAGVATAALGIAVGAAGGAVAALVGLDDNPVAEVVLRVLGHLVALGVDFLVVVFLVRGLAGARPLRRDLVTGALVVAVAAGVLRFVGTSVVGGSAESNPLLAPFAAIVVLLLWVNLIVRVLLMVCAWTVNPPAVPKVDPDQVTHAAEKPNFVTESEPETLAWDHDPQTGRIRPEDPEAPPPPAPYWGGLVGWAKRKYRGFRDA